MTQNGSGFVTWAAYDAALRSFAERVARLETQVAATAALAQSRGNRRWLLIMGVLTGIVAPVIVTTLIAWLHLRSQG
jgi:hypothetical protein